MRTIIFYNECINNDPNVFMYVEIRDNTVRSYMADVDIIQWSDIEVDAVLTRIFSHSEREKFFEPTTKNDDWLNNLQKYRL